MEHYLSFYVKTGQSFSAIKEVLTVNTEWEKRNVKAGIVSFGFMSGSDYEIYIEDICRDLKKIGIISIRIAITGDEDPWLELTSIEGDEQITNQIDFGLFDYLSECEDEDELSSALKKAQELGPDSYFLPMYQQWKEGFEKASFKSLDEIYEQIIGSCETK
ncbi:hypothetical protein [Algibacillus agarilyticus]|uniref:hypothetical protein n=1 Tax=Algibacillus agarilyticus TaxID=2234133 RepID=UPI000DCFA3F6|nr:hypothetical protein [Algibacillus agarilyticus]